MRFKRLAFDNRSGHRLSARLDMPLDEAPVAFALFAHCFTCGKDLKAAYNISRALTQEKIAVLRFDFTGLGESQGDFADTSFSSNVEDIVDAAQYLAEAFAAPAILIGHSLGGAAVIQAARHIPSAKAVAVIGAPADPAHVFRHFGDAAETIREAGAADVTISGRTFKIKRRFLDDLASNRMSEAIAGLKRALIIFHAPTDDVVGVDNAGRIFQAARHPKSFVSLDRADHLLSRAEDSIYVGTVIAAWARKYVALPKPAPDAPPPSDNRLTVRIGEERYATEIVAGGHSLTADEPESVGGTDTGPTPYDLLVASLGACTAITLRMYADRRNWPLTAVTVRLRHEKVHAEDCKACDSGKGAVDRIEREIELTGALTAEQRQRLAEIAERCPVHRTLHGEIQLETRLAPDSAPS